MDGRTLTRAPNSIRRVSPRSWSGGVVVAVSLALLSGACSKSTDPGPADPTASKSPPPSPQPPPVGAAAEPKYLDQGWSAERRGQFHYTAQGSQLVPYSWFLALEQPDGGGALRDDAYLDGLGFLTNRDEAGGLNPDHLPVGFVREVDDQGRAWLGMTCAACHTGQIEHQGVAWRIDGAPAQINLNRLLADMKRSLEQTVADDARFERFAGQVLGPDASAEAPALREAVREYLGGMVRVSADVGFSRQDAFGAIFNELLGTELGIPDNVRPCNAPVSFPHLWLTPRLAWVQWDGLAENPIGRNIGEVLGVFGHIEIPEGPPSPDGLASTIRLKNLFALEQWVDELRPPAWPAELPPVDEALAARGKTLYQEGGRCSRCHALPPYPLTPPERNQFGKQFIEIEMVPLEEIGTDPTAAVAAIERTALTGALAPYLDGQKEAPAMRVLILATNLVFVHEAKALGLSEEEQVAYAGFRLPAQDPPDLQAYKAGPLAGVWATAPYLHNGSVPSLYQLLLPPAERVKSFHVGSRQFDPVDVGFVTDASPRSSELDTSLEGNRNTGHDYSSDLSEEDRRALVEFLKTL